ncbi:hypothetical protein ES705_33750 [subsurface metagenome]
MPYPIIQQFSSNQKDVHVTGPYPVPVSDWLVGGIRQSVIGVGLTPMALPTVSMIDRRWISVYNNSDYTIYLGNASVAIGDGQPLESRQPFAINLDQNVILYAVGEAALTMCDTRILEGA